MYKNSFLLLFFIVIFWFPSLAQVNTARNLGGSGLSQNTEYEIGAIVVNGSSNLDKDLVILLSGLSVGDKINIPGEELSKAIKKLWKQKLFEDIDIYVTQKQGKIVFLEIRLKELPKLSKFAFSGVKKSKKDDLREKIQLSRGQIVTENLMINTKNIIREYYIEKGYLNAGVDISQQRDTTENQAVILNIHVKRGKRVRIRDIHFQGNSAITDQKLRKAMKETKKKGLFPLFKSSKMIEELYREDLKKIVDKYKEEGYRDARVTKDTIYRNDEKTISLDISIEEGKKYYFGNIKWLGNTKYSDAELDRVFNISKGDLYNASLIQERLFLDRNGRDISSLYLDNGYLFFDVKPVEVQVKNDSIDIEMRMREGRQATVNKITIKGNDRTNDHVVIREIRTRPGDLFRRSDIQRTFRELSQLGFFDPQEMGVNPQPNPETGTVDIEYTVAEKPSSQLELQAGYGNGRLLGTVALLFNNFSARRIFKKGAWAPLPAGDGQTVSLRVQANSFFQSYSASFTEPWLGGKKPTSLTFSIYHNIQTNGRDRDDDLRESLSITGLTLGMGKRLKWPDDYFTLYQAVEYQHYKLDNYRPSLFDFSKGYSNNISYRVVLGRNNTLLDPIYPTRGSNFSLTLKLTPPYSLFEDKDYETIGAREKYKFMEYHKWKFQGTWYNELFLKNLVLRTHTEFGFLGTYNDELGLAPFERFYVGGDGLQNFVLDGRETIALRGYPNNSLTPDDGGTLYNKFTMELRYLISPNPNAKIFGLVFAEAGNSWDQFKNYKPFQMKRSAGMGIRIFMPMFGLLGVDFGHGYDNIPGFSTPSGWQTHFIIGQQF